MDVSAFAQTKHLARVLDRRTVALLVCSATTAGITGVLLGSRPILATALVAALLFLTVASVSAVGALVLATPLLYLEGFRALSIASSLGLLVAFAAAMGANAFRWDRTLRRVAYSGRFFGSAAMFVLWIGLTSLWARSPGDALSNWKQWVVSLGGSVLIVILIVSPIRVRALVHAAVAGACVSVVLGVLGHNAHLRTFKFFDVFQAGRLNGGELDPNYLGAMIVLLLPVALAVSIGHRRPIVRALYVGALVLLLYGLYRTQSRGGFVALGGVLLIAPLFVPKGRRRHVLGPMLLLALAGVALMASTGAAAHIARTDRGSSGRSDLWRLAWRAWTAHPVGGVGLNNFAVSAPVYLNEPGSPLPNGTRLVVDSRKPVHNAFLGLLAETGLIGLILYAIVVATAIRAAFRASLLFARRGDAEMQLLSRMLALGLLGTLTASFFLSNASDQRTWFFLALAALLPSIAASNFEPALERASSSGRSGPRRARGVTEP